METVPLISTRRPVGFIPEKGALFTTKSKVLTPATKPVLIVNGLKLPKPGEALPT